jgi:Ca2+-binding RTX toxin-like protein
MWRGLWAMGRYVRHRTLAANATDLTGNVSVTSAATTAIIGTAGNDVLSDTPGTAATMVGGAGNDTYLVHSAADIVTEQANDGTDTINTTLNSYTLGTNVENLAFIGIGSFAGTDILKGGAGNDVLIGGGGNDTMTGGVGNDIFKYTAANFGADIITDFASSPVGGQDLIDISGLGITATTFAKSVTISGGINASVAFDGGTIQLTGVNQNTISITDFKVA